MPGRSYQQSCSLARALDTVGERWTLLVVRELLIGPLRYGEIQDRLPGIGTNLLADRLRHMEKLGLAEKLPGNGGHLWGLTAAGMGLEPALMALIRWGMKTRLPSRPGEISRTEWDLIAMKALFVPGQADGLEGTFQLVLNAFPAVLTIRSSGLEITRGWAETPGATIHMDSSTGWRLATGSLGRPEAVATGRLKISGNRGAAERLLDCFRLT
jgi:DNA-binding HxlR family transcriptional regulator/putative sterol carrier protein